MRTHDSDLYRRVLQAPSRVSICLRMHYGNMTSSRPLSIKCSKRKICPGSGHSSPRTLKMILRPCYPSPRNHIGTLYSPTPFQYSIFEYICSPGNAHYWARWAALLMSERSQAHFLARLADGYERRRSVLVHCLIIIIFQIQTRLEATLPEYFVESWTYSSALSVVEQCDNWANGLKLESSAQAAIHASKGELLELARNQVSSP
jgi:hypothetical protein